jgi:hypothetical protein
VRKTLSAVLLAACAFGTTVAVTPASAVCGGGQPGEACYCPPSEIKVGKITIPTGINC